MNYTLIIINVASELRACVSLEGKRWDVLHQLHRCCFEHREILELSVGNMYKVITVKSLAVYVLFSSECV